MRSRFKFYWKQGGGHIHIRVFVCSHVGITFGKSGDLTMTEAEFKDFRVLCTGDAPWVEFIEE